MLFISCNLLLKIDKKLMELNILQKHKDDADTITFDLTLFASIVAEEDLSVIKNIKKSDYNIGLDLSV